MRKGGTQCGTRRRKNNSKHGRMLAYIHPQGLAAFGATGSGGQGHYNIRDVSQSKVPSHRLAHARLEDGGYLMEAAAKQ